MAVVEIQDVTFRYRGASRPSLEEVRLRLEEGEALLVTGPSGSGKSTLLRLLNGLIPHFYEGELRGRVVVQGRDTREVRPNRLALQVGTVPQFPGEQIVALRVWRDVAFGLENLGLPREEILARVDEALAFVGLEPLRDRQVTTLSGGEQQRLALAGALAMRPRLLLLDEPASELDPRGRAAFVALIGRMARARDRTVVVADHRIEDLAPLVDRVLVLREGRVLLEGPPSAVLASDRLADAGVEVPTAVRAWKRLAASGLEGGGPPLTVEELAARWPGAGGDGPGA